MWLPRGEAACRGHLRGAGRCPCRGQLLLVFEGEVLQTEITKQWGKRWSWGSHCGAQDQRERRGGPRQRQRGWRRGAETPFAEVSPRALGLCLHSLLHLVHGFQTLSVPIRPMEMLLACTSQG